MNKHRCPRHPEEELVQPFYSPYDPYQQCPVCGIGVCLQCGTTEYVSPLSGICEKCYDQNLKLKRQRDRDRQIELLRIEREHGEMVKALELIAGYSQSNGCCPYGCDAPSIAQVALAKARGEQV